MANINEILARAAALRDETALNSIDPERAGSIMYDTLIALNELWLQQGAALVISKIYASVAAMNADTSPVSDLTGQPIRPGMIVVIASSDTDNGSVYRYNGTSAPRWSLVGKIGNLEPVDSLDSDSTQLPLAAHQGKVLDGKISQLGQYVDNPEFLRVVTDQSGKILYGIKKDGNFFFGAGCPPQVKDYIIQQIENIEIDVSEQLAGKVDKVTGKSLIDSVFSNAQSAIENPEFLEVKTDLDGKILEGLRKNGERFFGVFPPQIKRYVDDEVSGLKKDIDSSVEIENPYIGLNSKVRQNAISHEHMSGDSAQARLEKAVNDGVDIICASNYTPGVPVYPLQGYSYNYVELEFIKDNNGNIVYDKYDDGTIKKVMIRDGAGYLEFNKPALKRVIKTLSGSFSNFIKESGGECVVADLVQLPNAEHTQYIFADGWNGNGMHINLIGTTWAEAVNGDPTNTDLLADIAKYNQENGYNFNMTGFHAIFGIWTLDDVLKYAQYNYLFEGKIFGTINHPGFSGLRGWQVDELMKAGGNIFKGMEIYNNGETTSQAQYSIEFYDKMLMRGHKLWCLSVNDWGNDNTSNPERRGCNRLYLASDYNSVGASAKRLRALDAYIQGSFSACGYGTIDLASVNVADDVVRVSFNTVPDRTVVDIDGVRTEFGAVQSLSAKVSNKNTFVRFEAYKGDDFIFTQPFYVKKKY